MKYPVFQAEYCVGDCARVTTASGVSDYAAYAQASQQLPLHLQTQLLCAPESIRGLPTSCTLSYVVQQPFTSSFLLHETWREAYHNCLPIPAPVRALCLERGRSTISPE